MDQQNYSVYLALEGHYYLITLVYQNALLNTSIINKNYYASNALNFAIYVSGFASNVAANARIIIIFSKTRVI